MNYYEELGVRQDAAIEEIRQAYRVLTRLLHPDGQSDVRLKAMAECQMRRLNEILAILTDSQKRRQYDASLYAGPKAALEWGAPPVPAAPAYWYRVAYFGLRHWFWILIGLVVAGVGLWYVQQGTPQAAAVGATSNAAAPGGSGSIEPGGDAPPPQFPVTAIQPAATHATAAPPREATHPAAGPVAVADKPAAKPSPLAAARSSSAVESLPPAPPAPAPVAIAVAEPPRVVAAAKLEPASPPAKASETSFAGNWFYAPEPATKQDANLYPATYVEFELAEENGSLAGSYRAKYKIPDQAISPDVRFRVQGKSPNGKTCRLAWTSDDGARGEAELKLRSSNRMNVTWWTTVFGSRAALSSGMAELIRQQAP
jgi:hypothetical protein